jgi:hypothetical protein
LQSHIQNPIGLFNTDGGQHTTMNQKKSDQEWQQLQAHVEGFCSQALRSDTQRIEYRPQFIAHLALPSEHHQIQLRDGMTVSDNFRKINDEHE